MTALLLLPLLLLTACTASGVKLDGDDSASVSTPTDPVEAAAAVTDLSARLHDEIGSVVYVSWTQVEATDSVWVEYQFEGDTWLSTPVRTGDAGPHEQIVLGVPYGTPLSWRVVVQTGASSDNLDGPAITTDPEPADLPTIQLDLADESGWDPTGRFLLTSVSTEEPMRSNTPAFWVTLIDRQGRYVWAIPANERSWTLYTKPSRDGTSILYDDDLYWTSFDPDADSQIHQILLDGSELRTWDVPGLAHSFDDLSADTIAWDKSNRGDDVVVLSVGDAEPVEIWSCLDWIATSDIARSPDNPNRESCGANALSYNEDRGTYTISLWSHETVLEFVADSGEVLWYADPNEGHGYSVPADAIWQWQHEAQSLSADRILLSSGVDQDRQGGFAATASYEYQLDPATESMTLVWSYLSEPEFAAQYKGGLRRLPGGNTLHYYGSGGGVKEITPAGEVVWQIQFDENYDSWTGRSYFLDDLYAFAP